MIYTKASLNFLSAILNFYKSNKNVFEKETENKFTELINSIELEKHIILYVYDNSVKNFEFRKEIIELINLLKSTMNILVLLIV